MKKRMDSVVVVAVPFGGYDGWDEQIDSCVEMEIERLEGDGDEADAAFLESLKEDDFDRDAIYDRASKDYVEIFNELVREEAGIELSLAYRGRDEFSIYANMSTETARGLLRKVGKGPTQLDSDDWEALICALLPDGGEDVSTTIFTILAENYDSFYPT